MTIKELKAHFYKGRARAFAWPGGYPVYFLCSDGESLCPDCVTRERKNIFRAVHAGDTRDDWHVIAVTVNWEDAELFCAHCKSRIESAYAEN